MENEARRKKFEAQDAFWKSIIQKYEARNQDLEKEQLGLQQKIDQMDANMPAVMAFNMAKLAQGQPDADVGSLVKIPCTCLEDEGPKEKLKIPDMSCVSVFSIEDEDVHYMDRIKELTDQEKKLIDEVNRLRSKEKAIKDAKKKVEKLCGQDRKSGKLTVDGNEMQKMNERLLDENRCLNHEIADLKLEMKHIRETVEGPLSRELDRERRRALKLEAQLKEKMSQESASMGTIQREMDFLREQLKAGDRNLRDMVDINNQLKVERDIIESRMQELQNDLIHQKISEATCLAILKTQLKKCEEGQGGGGGGPSGGGGGGRGGGGGEDGGGVCPCLRKPPCTKHGSLYEIARDLSRELQGAELNKGVPDELKDTVNQIKSLCDLIDENICDDKTKGDKEEELPGTGDEVVLAVEELEVKEEVAEEAAEEVCDTEIEPKEEELEPKEEDVEPKEEEPEPKEEEELDKVPERESKEEIPVKDLAPKVDSEYVEEIETVTELEEEPADGIQVKKISDGLNVTTTITRSGILEVVTEGPAGLIETTLTVTESGNVEVVTEYTEITNEAGTDDKSCMVKGKSEDSDLADACKECGFFQREHAGVGKDFGICSSSRSASDKTVQCSCDEVTICSSEDVESAIIAEYVEGMACKCSEEEIIIEEDVEEEKISTGSSKCSAFMDQESSFAAKAEEDEEGKSKHTMPGEEEEEELKSKRDDDGAQGDVTTLAPIEEEPDQMRGEEEELVSGVIDYTEGEDAMLEGEHKPGEEGDEGLQDLPQELGEDALVDMLEHDLAEIVEDASKLGELPEGGGLDEAAEGGSKPVEGEGLDETAEGGSKPGEGETPDGEGEGLGGTAEDASKLGEGEIPEGEGLDGTSEISKKPGEEGETPEGEGLDGTSEVSRKPGEAEGEGEGLDGTSEISRKPGEGEEGAVGPEEEILDGTATGLKEGPSDLELGEDAASAVTEKPEAADSLSYLDKGPAGEGPAGEGPEAADLTSIVPTEGIEATADECKSEVDECATVVGPEDEVLGDVKPEKFVIGGGEEEDETVKEITTVVEGSMEETFMKQEMLEKPSSIGTEEIKKPASVLSVIREEVEEPAKLIELVDAGVVTDVACVCISAQTDGKEGICMATQGSKLNVSSVDKGLTTDVVEPEVEVTSPMIVEVFDLVSEGGVVEGEEEVLVEEVDGEGEGIGAEGSESAQKGSTSGVSGGDSKVTGEKDSVSGVSGGFTAGKDSVSTVSGVKAEAGEHEKASVSSAGDQERTSVSTAEKASMFSGAPGHDKASLSEVSGAPEHASASSVSGHEKASASTVSGAAEHEKESVSTVSGGFAAGAGDTDKAGEGDEADEDEWHDADDGSDKKGSAASLPTQKTQESEGMDETSKSVSNIPGDHHKSEVSFSKRSSRSAICSRKQSGFEMDLPPCDCGPHPNDCMCIDCISEPLKDEVSMDVSDISKLCGCVGPCDCACDLELKTCGCTGECMCKKKEVDPNKCTCGEGCKCVKCRVELPPCDCEVCLCRDCKPEELHDQILEELCCGCKVCACTECKFMRAQLGGDFVCDCQVPCDCEECLFLAAKLEEEKADCLCAEDTCPGEPIKKPSEVPKAEEDEDEEGNAVCACDDDICAEEPGKEPSVVQASLKEEGVAREPTLESVGAKSARTRSTIRSSKVPTVESVGSKSAHTRSTIRTSKVPTVESVGSKSAHTRSTIRTSQDMKKSKSADLEAPVDVVDVEKSESADVGKRETVEALPDVGKRETEEALADTEKRETVEEALPDVGKRETVEALADVEKRETVEEALPDVGKRETVEEALPDVGKRETVEALAEVGEAPVDMEQPETVEAPADVEKRQTVEVVTPEAEKLELPRGTCVCPKDAPCRKDCEKYNIKIGDAKKAPSRASATKAKQHEPLDTIPTKDTDCTCDEPQLRKEVAELSELMDQIKCACQEAETVAKPPLIKQASDMTDTLSNLEVALEALQQKSETKDVLIDALKEELRLRTKSIGFENIMDDLFTDKDDVCDYDRSTLVESLPKPLDKGMMRFGKLPPKCVCGTQNQQDDPCECKVSSAPLEIVDIRRIGPGSILIKWIPARSNEVMGYEICVEGVVRSRVFSPRRNSAIVDGLSMKTSMNISIYATCYEGRCRPAAVAVYKL